ncbi:hypothetical protein EDB85DRAFT_1895338 [Lactarius pseudohatsudake]|nr:hypothetical protein EDB85DRAFT_1895338 [Lactarius pseudohatsudake]
MARVLAPVFGHCVAWLSCYLVSRSHGVPLLSFPIDGIPFFLLPRTHTHSLSPSLSCRSLLPLARPPLVTMDRRRQPLHKTLPTPSTHKLEAARIIVPVVGFGAGPYCPSGSRRVFILEVGPYHGNSKDPYQVIHTHMHSHVAIDITSRCTLPIALQMVRWPFIPRHCLVLARQRNDDGGGDNNAGDYEMRRPGQRQGWGDHIEGDDDTGPSGDGDEVQRGIGAMATATTRWQRGDDGSNIEDSRWTRNSNIFEIAQSGYG